MKKPLALTLAAVTILAALAARSNPSALAASGQAAARSWQALSPPQSAPSFILPVAMAADGNGHLYVADAALDQVQKLSTKGRQLQVLGSFGWRLGHLFGPNGVGLDQWGNIYVEDSGNHRIEIFSPSGQPRSAINLSPNSYPQGMAVDRWGTIYLSYYNGIQKRSPRGSVLAWWPGNGTSTLAVDGAGNVYFSRYGKYGGDTQYYPYIVKLSPQGRTLAHWRYATGYPQAIAVSASGRVYVLDPGAGQISELSAAGSIAAQLSIPGARGYGTSGALAVDRLGNAYLARPQMHQVIKLSPAGDLLGVWGMRVSTPGRLRLPGGVAADARGNIFVADSWNDRIQELSPSGALIRSWGGPGHGPGRFNLPTDVLVDRQGNVLVADLGNSRLEIFSPSGRFLRSVRVPGSHYVYRYQPYFPYYGQQTLRIALDPQGNYLVADSSLNRVVLLSPTGGIVRVYSQWVTTRDSRAAGVAIDGAGSIYVTDSGAAHIVKLSPSGHRLAVWGQFGYVGLGTFNRPAGITVDAAGNIYVSDTSNQRVQELSPSGQPLQAWGGLGAGPGQFAYPQGLAVASNGTVYVADTWNNRVQVLRP